MPRFEKGSQEAKDFMASLRAKRGAKKGGYISSGLDVPAITNSLNNAAPGSYIGQGVKKSGGGGDEVMAKVKKSLARAQAILENQTEIAKQLDDMNAVNSLVRMKNSTPTKEDLDYLSMPPPTRRPSKKPKKKE